MKNKKIPTTDLVSKSKKIDTTSQIFRDCICELVKENGDGTAWVTGNPNCPVHYLPPVSSVKEGKSYFDYADEEKRYIVQRAAEESSKARKELMDSVKEPLSTEWEEIYRLEMAKILGSEGKFAMNSMIALTRSLLAKQRQEIREKVTQFAIEGKDEEQEWKGFSLYAKIMKLLED